MPPTISVIIPAYNRAMTISRSIRSVLDQTVSDFEIIVVDDGSIDETRQVVRGIEDGRIRLICHERNSGAAAARNTGMRAAAGKYIAWLDSDDEWLPDKLRAQIDALSHAPSDVKACFSAQERIEQGRTRIFMPRHTDRKTLLLGCDLGPGSTLLFERAVLDDVGYLDEAFARYEDWDWLLRYCAKYRLVGVDQPLARVHYTRRRPAPILEASARTFISKYSVVLGEYGWHYRRVVISRRWMEVASYYAQEHNLKKMVYHLAQALSMTPFQPLQVWAWVINSWFHTKIGTQLADTLGLISLHSKLQ
jgi:glycosyltransferase involved in cell wall biosynthesis